MVFLEEKVKLDQKVIKVIEDFLVNLEEMGQLVCLAYQDPKENLE